MADNYLEKKMEDLRNGKLGRKSVRRVSNMEYKNIRVFVTGGASGIGRKIVEELRRLDCRVAFCDINRDAGEQVASVYGALFYECNVCDSRALTVVVENVLEVWGDLDVIVNNVGIGDFRPFERCTLNQFDKVLKTNLYPVFITSNLLVHHREKMKGDNNSADYSELNPYGGRIINISSTRHIQSEPGTEAYAASKGGITSLTHALAVSMEKYGITVNCISPGWINTDSEFIASTADNKQHPSGRIGEPGDIARLVTFLIDRKNNFINGVDIVVDGGMTKRMIYSGDNGWNYNQ